MLTYVTVGASPPRIANALSPNTIPLLIAVRSVAFVEPNVALVTLPALFAVAFPSTVIPVTAAQYWTDACNRER